MRAYRPICDQCISKLSLSNSATVPRGIMRKIDESFESETKKAKVLNANTVEVFMNQNGNTGIIVNGQKFRKKRTRINKSVVWQCNRDQCRCTAVTTQNHCILSLGLHNHAVSEPIKDKSTPSPPSEASTPAPVEYLENQNGKQSVLYKAYKYSFHRDFKKLYIVEM